MHFPKNKRPTSQFWNSRGPRMPFLLVTLPICHLCSYQHCTCIYQSSPLWTKMTQVCIYNDFLRKKSTQECSLLFFLSKWQPCSLRFTMMNLMSRITALQPGGRRVVKCFLEQPHCATPTYPGTAHLLQTVPHRPIQAEPWRLVADSCQVRVRAVSTKPA